MAGGIPTVQIVTTAAIPWLTGTSINPLLRAVHLARRGLAVTLHVPWIEAAEQAAVYGPATGFATADAQAQTIRAWLPPSLRETPFELRFYPARWSARLRSIYPRRPLTEWLPPADTVILEEPEHLLLFTPAARLRRRYAHVVGIVHTSYAAYLPFIFGPRAARVVGPVQDRYYRWLARRSCHQLVRLSPAVTTFPDADTVNVNGVAPRYFELRAPVTSGFYFIGKLIWGKGFRELIELGARAGLEGLDVYGDGDDADAIRRAAGPGFRFHGAISDPAPLGRYRAFINASRTEVLCTATAEALAMGKWAIVPECPANEPFASSPGCLIYRTPDELVAHVARAAASEPPAVDTRALTWEAATERLWPYLRVGP